jgi:ubiquinone/menaquinone biosynthesis C-methylase UbiE
MESKHYIIRGGVEGRERLRLISRVMQPTTLGLFARLGVQAGMACLDVGCGGGDVTFDLARAVGSKGKVVGTDIDPVKLDLARREAEAQQLTHVEFCLADIVEGEPEPRFDLVYARFLLTHLKDRGAAVAAMRRSLRPGGVVVVEDIDFTGQPRFARSATHNAQRATRDGTTALLSGRCALRLARCALCGSS